jgi:hypothetical protein
MIALFVLVVALGISACLYFTVDMNFEAKVRLPPSSRTLKSGLSVEEIFNSTQKAWSIIDANRAVIDVQTIHGNVLPAGVSNAFELEQWVSPPASHSFVVEISNQLQQRVLQFVYSVQYVHGGSFNGHGRYLDRLTIVPTRISVAWGFVFNASVQINSVYNTGTHDEPVAAAQIELRYRLKGLNIVESTESFFVTGDGQFTHSNA